MPRIAFSISRSFFIKSSYGLQTYQIGISKKISELVITKVYDEALIKIDFGKYLRVLISGPPTDMVDPHAHHILYKKGLGQKQQELVREGQEILRRYGMDPIIGKENLVWAPNAVIGQHSLML